MPDSMIVLIDCSDACVHRSTLSAGPAPTFPLRVQVENVSEGVDGCRDMNDLHTFFDRPAAYWLIPVP